MTIMHTCNAKIANGVIEYACPVPGCGYRAVMQADGSDFHTVAWSTMPDVRHIGSVGGVTMGAAEVRQDDGPEHPNCRCQFINDAGPIPADYHIDPYTLARELDLGREDW